jgi:chromosomal replication initiation ATPase DnaA
VADVLEAVTYVAGVDPRKAGRQKSTMHARRLACHSLREITECSYPEIALTMGYADHTTALHHCAIPPDYDELRAVVERVSEKVGA